MCGIKFQTPWNEDLKVYHKYFDPRRLGGIKLIVN